MYLCIYYYITVSSQSVRLKLKTITYYYKTQLEENNI